MTDTNGVLENRLEFSEAAQKAYDEAKAFAAQNGLLENLEHPFSWLRAFGRREYVIRIGRDFAPHSFTFFIPGMIEGAIIYHGPRDRSHSAPTFAVTLTDDVGWTIHT